MQKKWHINPEYTLCIVIYFSFEMKIWHKEAYHLCVSLEMDCFWSNLHLFILCECLSLSVCVRPHHASFFPLNIYCRSASKLRANEQSLCGSFNLNNARLLEQSTWYPCEIRWKSETNRNTNSFIQYPVHGNNIVESYFFCH